VLFDSWIGTGQRDGTYTIAVTARNAPRTTAEGIVVTYVGATTTTTFRVQQNIEPSFVVQQNVVGRGAVFAVGTQAAGINTSGVRQEINTHMPGTNRILPVTILVSDADATDRLSGTCIVRNSSGVIVGTYNIVWATEAPTTQAIFDAVSPA